MDDLTPRHLDPDAVDGADADGSTGGRPIRTWLLWGAVGVIAIAVGVLLIKGLSDAAVFFKNADEAVAERDDLGERRFRLQGTVVDDSVDTAGTDVVFSVIFNDVTVDVIHEGAPPELFQERVPVVLEGRFEDTTISTDHLPGGTAAEGFVFASDRILVRHDNTYEADNGDRLDDAVTGGRATGAP